MKKKNEKVTLMKREQGWDSLDAKQEAALEKYCRDYIDFLSASKTERLAYANIKALAVSHGFVNLDSIIESGKKLKPGDKIYRGCDGKTLLLAVIGKQPVEKGTRFVGGHTDCPRLDAKPCPLYQDSDLVLLDTHYYGGIKKYQWTTIPLALYGVVIRKDGTKVELAIGDKPGDPVFTVTDILPHLDNVQSKKTITEAINGEQLNVLFGSRPVAKKDEDKNCKDKTKLRILRLLNEAYGIEEEDFCSAELEIVPAGAARELGFDRSMILGFGQDDRVCGYAAARALMDMKKIPDLTAGALICDKEEIGSYGRSGMDSTFFENTIAELVNATADRYSDLTVRRALEHSSMISADVTALHDPGYPESSSPNNQAKINCGVALSKYTGARGKSSTNDASAEFMGEIRSIFNKANVLWQPCEIGRVDVGGGGTIALYMARMGMNVVDCGVGLLCMHAPWEVAGKLDVFMAYCGYKAFMEAQA